MMPSWCRRIPCWMYGENPPHTLELGTEPFYLPMSHSRMRRFAFYIDQDCKKLVICSYDTGPHWSPFEGQKMHLLLVQYGDEQENARSPKTG